MKRFLTILHLILVCAVTVAFGAAIAASSNIAVQLLFLGLLVLSVAGITSMALKLIGEEGEGI